MQQAGICCFQWRRQGEADGSGPDYVPVAPAKASSCTIEPDSAWKGRWDIFMLTLILYSAVSVPIHIGFSIESDGTSLWYLEVSMSMAFVADLVLSFHTAYLDSEGRFVRDRKLIAQKYFRGWLCVNQL